VILVDTSAWIEFLRGAGTPACEQVDALLAEDLATCDPIHMEVLAGARNDTHLRNLRALMARAAVLQTRTTHYEHAARLYRQARTSGLTVRKHIDCLIAAVAIDHDVPLLHADRDFDALATVSELRVAR